MAEKKDSGEPSRKYWEQVQEKILEANNLISESMQNGKGALMQNEILLKYVEGKINELPAEIEKIIEEVKAENGG